MSDSEAEARFWQRVDRAKNDFQCWLWTAGRSGGRDGRQYGSLRVAGRWMYAHRYSYELAYGVCLSGRDVHHTCGNRLCVNPAHLELIQPMLHGAFSQEGRR